ncbi:MAG: SixA phosphatase family protein [Candidatus Cybelea sp.]
MNCYFLRHGVAVEPDEWTGRDFDRPLTQEGIERMECEARAFADLSLDLDAIVTSPLLRARQTAEIIASRLKLRDDIVEDARLAGGFDARRLAEILAEHDKAEAIMLVGHEPTMSATVGRMVGDASIELKKAALAGVVLSSASATRGTLICLIPPKVLVRLGKGRSRP